MHFFVIPLFFQCIETFLGNTMVSVAKNSEKEGLTITKMTFGNDFLLQVRCFELGLQLS